MSKTIINELNIMMKKSNFSQVLFRYIFLLIFGFIFVPYSVYAIGQMTKPIIVDNALRGQEFEQTLTIMNTDEEEVTINFLAENDIDGWVEFFLPEDMDSPITKLDMAAKERENIIAKFLIPEDIPNGEYKGLLSVKREAEKSTTTSKVTSKIARKVSRPITITVTDQEEINVSIIVTPEKYDLLPDESLKIRVKYSNQGNIVIKPQLHIKIVQAGKNFYNVILPYPEDEDGVKPLTTHEIASIEIPISGVKLGQVIAEFDVLHNQEIIQKENFKFNIRESSAGEWPIDKNLLIVMLVSLFLMVGTSIIIKRKGKKKKNGIVLDLNNKKKKNRK